MKLNIMFIIAAVYGVLIGLSALIAPAQMATPPGGGTPSPDLLMAVRFMGVANLGLGIIAWLVRNTDASTARDGVTMGFFIFFTLHAILSPLGRNTDSFADMSWVMAVVQGLIAVGFLLAGRASMSTNTK